MYNFGAWRYLLLDSSGASAGELDDVYLDSQQQHLQGIQQVLILSERPIEEGQSLIWNRYNIIVVQETNGIIYRGFYWMDTPREP